MEAATLTRPPDDLRTLYTSAPERSLAQRMDALNRANDVRTRRAQLKRDLRAGRRRVSQVLVDPPEYVESMKVIDLLLATPKWGVVKVNHTLRHIGMSPSKTVGGVSGRQRAELLRRLSGR